MCYHDNFQPPATEPKPAPRPETTREILADAERIKAIGEDMVRELRALD